MSTSKGIDTDQPGWELRVKAIELHNSVTIREPGRRVRRGQLERALGNLSTGDLPYGYESSSLIRKRLRIPVVVRSRRKESDVTTLKPDESDRCLLCSMRDVRFHGLPGS